MKLSKLLILPSIILTLIFSAQTLAKTDLNVKQVNDKDIVSVIKNTVNKEVILDGNKVQIDAKQGQVQVSGSVDNKVQAEKIIKIAEGAAGVKGVDSANLKVKNSDEPVSDMLITTKIKTRLFGEGLLSLTNLGAVSVSTTNGVAYLEGKVSSQTQIDKILTVARSVSGVKAVKSMLLVE